MASTSLRHIPRESSSWLGLLSLRTCALMGAGRFHSQPRATKHRQKALRSTCAVAVGFPQPCSWSRRPKFAILLKEYRLQAPALWGEFSLCDGRCVLGPVRLQSAMRKRSRTNNATRKRAPASVSSFRLVARCVFRPARQPRCVYLSSFCPLRPRTCAATLSPLALLPERALRMLIS